MGENLDRSEPCRVFVHAAYGNFRLGDNGGDIGLQRYLEIDDQRGYERLVVELLSAAPAAESGQAWCPKAALNCDFRIAGSFPNFVQMTPYTRVSTITLCSGNAPGFTTGGVRSPCIHWRARMAMGTEERKQTVVREVNERMVRRDMAVYDEHPSLRDPAVLPEAPPRISRSGHQDRDHRRRG